MSTPTRVADARILIVDDEPANVRLLERLVEREGCRTHRSTTDSREAARLFRELAPDLVLLDLHMPHVDGFGVMEQLRPLIRKTDFVPILVLTADITSEAKRRALSGGANDFLTKPLDATEVSLRIRNLLETRFLHLQLQVRNRLLEQHVVERTFDVEEAGLEILARLARASEFRDDDTGHHASRVGEVSARVARALGMSEEEAELVRRAAPLHDVGKIGVPDAILLKPGVLTREEWDVLQAHTTIGARILSGSTFPILQMAEEIALCHHERWDGTGYPRGLRGEEIPLVSRIVTVVDSYDALVGARPYKPAWPLEEAVAEIRAQRGRQFDPRVVDAFLGALGLEAVGVGANGNGAAEVAAEG